MTDPRDPSEATKPDSTETGAHSPLDTFLGASPRRGRRHLISLFVLLAAAVAILFLFVRFFAGEDSPYFVAPVAVGNVTPRLSERGEVYGERQLEIRARLAGRLEKLEVASGARVKYGQTLAVIDAAQAGQTLEAREAELRAAEAQLAAAQARAGEAGSRLARFERVWRESDHRVPSLNELEEARTRARIAREDVSAAENAVAAARIGARSASHRLAGTSVRAPFDGTIVVHDLHEGAAVREDALLFTLVPDDARLKLSVPIASRTAMKLSPGAKASVRFDDLPDLEQTATLASIEGSGDERHAEFVLEQPDQAIRPGMAARLEIELAERRDVLLVPNAALEFRPEGPANDSAGRTQGEVHLLADDGNPRRVYVTTGGSDGNRTEIFSEAVRPGDDVIIGWRDPPGTAPDATGSGPPAGR